MTCFCGLIWGVGFVGSCLSVKQHQPARALAQSRMIQGRGGNDACGSALLTIKCLRSMRKLLSLLAGVLRSWYRPGLVNFFCQEPDSKYFKLSRHCGLCHNYSTSPL